MQNFFYKAMNKDGTMIRGRMMASDEEELKSLLHKKDLYFVSSNSAFSKKVGNKQLDNDSLIILCRQLSSILQAGMTLVTSLEMLHNKLDKPKIKNAIEGLYEQVQKGNSLSAAMESMKGKFPTMMVNMVKAGEMSGEIDKTLANLGDHFEKEAVQNKQIKSAMSYPMFLLGITIVVVIAMMVFIIPMLVGESDPATLPGVTRFLMGGANFIKEHWALLLVIVIVLIFGIKALLKMPKVRYQFDKLKLYMPKMGKLVRMIYTGRFARALATLYTNGVEFMDAMGMCIGIVGNTFAAKELEDSIVKIQQGESISVAMAKTKSFDPLLISMIYVGEESGALDTVLVQTADYFDGESSASIKGITAMIQPIMLCVMAVLIGIVLIGILGPILNMYDFDAISEGANIIDTTRGGKF